MHGAEDRATLQVFYACTAVVIPHAYIFPRDHEDRSSSGQINHTEIATVIIPSIGIANIAMCRLEVRHSRFAISSHVYKERM